MKGLKVVQINTFPYKATGSIMMNLGSRMYYHKHHFRDEVWNIVKGTGIAVVDGKKINVKPGDMVKLPRECKHTVIAETDLEIIEIQSGEEHYR